MINPHIYLLPCRGWRGTDVTAAIQLLRETYTVVKFGLAPMCIGMLYETSAPVAPDHREVLGLVPWE